ncbi:bli-3-like protein 2 [Elsinoe australis]|uniref:Bli-3-like protein 2 n=1 Tax=Elsinoe australis TaxID=40998 RepID=A0A4U7AV70_9PEZI|nr:bli-3-like protein 2 [Elsinoe australis]
MPEQLTKQEVNSKTDPSVAKQWDNEVPLDTKLSDLYAITDKLKVCLLGTLRNGTGPVHRSMAVAKRTGPDFLFLANAHSRKFEDIESNPGAVSITFQNSSTQDWISVTGKAVTSDNEDPRIKEIWSRGTSAWFGDLGDGVHTGKPEDPRMKLIEIQASYISYWKADVGTLGFGKEVIGAIATGGVANTGSLRQLEENEIQQARKKDSSMSS